MLGGGVLSPAQEERAELEAVAEALSDLRG